MKTLKALALMASVFILVLGAAKGSWASPPLPDLTVTRIESVQQGLSCKLRITIANIGDGEIPQHEFMDIGVRVNNGSGNSNWGKLMLDAIDPARKLANPHSELTFIWDPPGHAHDNLLQGDNHIIVTVDCYRMLNESNETNNTLERTLTCRTLREGSVEKKSDVPHGRQIPVPALPDLTVVKVEEHFLCGLKITLANTGNGVLPPVAYDPSSNGVEIEVRNGTQRCSMMLRNADPMKKLSHPHSRLSFIWNPGGCAQKGLLPGKNRIKVTVDSSNMVVESNENNNSMERVISCPRYPTTPKQGASTRAYHAGTPLERRSSTSRRPLPPASLPDLTVTKIAKTPDCKIKITIANIGQGSLSPIDYDTGSGGVWLRMLNGNHNWGSMVLGQIDKQKKLLNPNGHITFIWKSNRRGCSKLLPGKNVIKVTIDTDNNVKESNENNNSLTKTLTCPLSPVKAIREPHKTPRKPLPREKVENFNKQKPVNQLKVVPKTE